ncbi:hypothetical protein, partial [Ralstonia pseudosolanacearum]
MRDQNRSPQTLALAQLCELARQLTPEVGRASKRPVRASATTLRQLETTSTLIYTTTEDACARLLNISTGLIGILQLLDLWSDRAW